jgi:hypothetical protein
MATVQLEDWLSDPEMTVASCTPSAFGEKYSADTAMLPLTGRVRGALAGLE